MGRAARERGRGASARPGHEAGGGELALRHGAGQDQHESVPSPCLSALQSPHAESQGRVGLARRRTVGVWDCMSGFSLMQSCECASAAKHCGCCCYCWCGGCVIAAVPRQARSPSLGMSDAGSGLLLCRRRLHAGFARTRWGSGSRSAPTGRRAQSASDGRWRWPVDVVGNQQQRP